MKVEFIAHQKTSPRCIYAVAGNLGYNLNFLDQCQATKRIFRLFSSVQYINTYLLWPLWFFDVYQFSNSCIIAGHSLKVWLRQTQTLWLEWRKKQGRSIRRQSTGESRARRRALPRPSLPVAKRSQPGSFVSLLALAGHSPPTWFKSRCLTHRALKRHERARSV